MRKADSPLERFFLAVLRHQESVGLMKRHPRGERAWRMTKKGMRWWLVLDTFVDATAAGGKRRKRIASK